MKPALVLSFLLNIALIGGIIFFQTKTQSLKSSPSPEQVAQEAHRVAPPKSASVIAANKTGAETEAEWKSRYSAIWLGSTENLYKQLLAWGAPKEMIVDILFSKDRRDYGSDARLAILYPKGLNRWSAAANLSRENMAKLNEMNAARRETLRQVMGPDFDLVLAEADPVQRFKWGNISDDKVVAVKRISEQYDSLAVKSNSPVGVSKSAIQAAALLDSEFSADIRSVLPPAEAEDFLTFNSPVASNLQKDLARANIDVDEAEYRALLKKIYDFRGEAVKLTGDDLFQNAMNETKTYESALGVERALALADSKMMNFREYNSIMASAGLDSATRLNLYYDYMQTTIKVTQLQNDPALNSQVMAEGTRFYNHLASILPPQKLQELMNTREGQFIQRLRTGARSPRANGP